MRAKITASIWKTCSAVGNILQPREKGRGVATAARFFAKLDAPLEV